MSAQTAQTKTSIQTILSGVWHNQHNSEMHLEVDESGKIVGCFINGINRIDDRSESFPLSGFARGDVFSFVVDFSRYGCMTSWVGQIVDPGNKTFTASWQMITDAHRQKEWCWKSIFVGQDTFASGPRESAVSNQRAQASHPSYCSVI